MAILAKVKTSFGEERELYIRLNNIESNNHNHVSVAKFRGFLSQEAYVQNFNYVWECDVEFLADVSLPLWSQGYEELKRTLGLQEIVFTDS